MALDWLTGNLYWSDNTAGAIYVSNSEGRYRSTVVEGLTNQKGIAVNPLTG